jgi:hypothetical protein
MGMVLAVTVAAKSLPHQQAAALPVRAGWRASAGGKKKATRWTAGHSCVRYSLGSLMVRIH